MPPTGPPLNASQSFGYDRVNRLIASSEGGTWTRNYNYDQFGNGWVALNSILPLDPTTPTASTNFDANNRLNIDGAAYNAAGNQTAIAGFSNSYDAENRQVTSVLNGVTTTYTYDGDGRRVQKATGGSTTTYVYDAAGQLAAEYTSVAPPAAPCGTCYLTEDHLGSTRMMTDGTSGKPVAFHDYVPFGEEIQAGVGGRSGTYYPPGPLAINDTVAQKFTGKERDAETGLDYFGARYYGSPQGRFTSPDPLIDLKEALLNPQRWNGYAYALDNPLLYIDPDGAQARRAHTVFIAVATAHIWRRSDSADIAGLCAIFGGSAIEEVPFKKSSTWSTPGMLLHGHEAHPESSEDLEATSPLGGVGFYEEDQYNLRITVGFEYNEQLKAVAATIDIQEALNPTISSYPAPPPYGAARLTHMHGLGRPKSTVKGFSFDFSALRKMSDDQLGALLKAATNPQDDPVKREVYYQVWLYTEEEKARRAQ